MHLGRFAYVKLKRALMENVRIKGCYENGEFDLFVMPLRTTILQYAQEPEYNLDCVSENK